MTNVNEPTVRTKVRVLVAAIAGQHVLLVRRQQTQWGFPGKLVPMEDLLEKAAGILHAEAGMHIDPSLITFGAKATSDDKVCHLYLAVCKSGAFAKLKEAGPRGHAVATCTLSELDTIGLRSLHRDMILKLRQ